MLKRDVADQLYSVAVRRIRGENPNIVLDEDKLKKIWDNIYSILNKEGMAKAREYAFSIKIGI